MALVLDVAVVAGDDEQAVLIIPTVEQAINDGRDCFQVLGGGGQAAAVAGPVAGPMLKEGELVLAGNRGDLLARLGQGSAGGCHRSLVGHARPVR